MVSDYEKVASVIRFLDSNRSAQTSVARMAGVAGLSESRFHRVFLRWAGVTPKDFLQCLSVEYAKSLLRDPKSVLDASLDAGLSGPGRLHDLTVNLEAASPGELKSGGLGIEVTWGFSECPFGLCSVGWNARGICHLAFHDRAVDFPESLGWNWPMASLTRSDRAAARLAADIFESGSGRELRVFVPASRFQSKVWRALLQIPSGSLTSYSRIASAVGCPSAARAVGTACGANPVAYLIPCHRVIRETGIVKGYRWGTERKLAMLVRESGAPAFCSKRKSAEPGEPDSALLEFRRSGDQKATRTE
ncbi:MAG: methylated-DNA--[protein]-cysteine S-methyltransferase [Verrucomicrobiaceae bacterium]|nr:MAG: methylated-DNA--[protein]-cysteine S-methyltransferase [Verrucomicrobiaceae bacterium]